MTLCAYKRHREHDWMLKDGRGPIICGVCHPPARPTWVVRRDEFGWNKAVLRYGERVAEGERRARDPFGVLEEGE